MFSSIYWFRALVNAVNLLTSKKKHKYSYRKLMIFFIACFVSFNVWTRFFRYAIDNWLRFCVQSSKIIFDKHPKRNKTLKTLSNLLKRMQQRLTKYRKYWYFFIMKTSENMFIPFVLSIDCVCANSSRFNLFHSLFFK